MDEQNIQNPYEIQLADVAEEIGADIKIEYYKATITFNRAQLKQIKAVGLPTDVMSLVMFALMEHGKSKDEIVDFFAEAQEHNQSPRVTFGNPEGEEGLNVKSQSENPELDKLVQCAEKRVSGIEAE